MKAVTLVLLLACAAAHGTAAPVAPDDFAFGRTLSLEGTAAIYRVPLPPEVYRHAVHGDLADLRVFNAAGEPVPHSLRRPRHDASPRENPLELSFFPLPGQADDPVHPLAVAVTRDADGAVVRIEEKPALAQASRPGGYLVDTSQLERPPDALELEWTGARSNFVARIRIAGSDDLASWRPLVDRASVARLHFAGRLLERRRIELPRNTDFTYLRLDWPEETGAATLSAVTAWFREPLPEIRRGWVELEGVPAKDDRPAFDYELGDPVAVDRVGLSLPPGNALVAATIASRNERSDWRLRHRGSFYRVEIDGAVMAQEDAAIGATRASHWRVTTEGGTGTGAAPRLRLGWVLDDLYFLTRGDAPFTLAYGAADAPPDATGVDELLARIDARGEEGFIGNARAGETFELGGEARLRPAPRAPPWRQILLWGVLVLGVFGLGVMAWQLWRQMTQDRPAG